MKRKVYTTRDERQNDQLIGFFAFPFVNTLLWALTNWLLESTGGNYHGPSQGDPLGLAILSLPWIVNGIILALAFIFRPQIGVGYLGFVVLAIGGGIVLGVVFLVACFIGVVPVGILGSLGPIGVA